MDIDLNWKMDIDLKDDDALSNTYFIYIYIIVYLKVFLLF